MKVNKILNWLIIVFVVLIIGLLLFWLNASDDKKVSLQLYGEKELNVYQGEEYLESGYFIVKKESDNNDYQVNVISNVNINVIGDYSIKYQLLFND